MNAEAVGEPLLRPQPAADPEVERDAAVRAARRDEPDVGDLVPRAVERAAGDRDFEFARQVRELVVVEEVPVDGEREGLGVDELRGVDAGEGEARDVARVILARRFKSSFF